MTDPLEQIKERNAKRTPGPWEKTSDNEVWVGTTRQVFDADSAGDAEFIAHSPEDMDWVIAEVEKLRSRYVELRTAVGAGWAVLDRALGVYSQHVDPPTSKKSS